MAEYGKFCPISMATEVVADRWTPMILRELIIGSTRFNDIARGLPGISRSLLVQRLAHLERKGVLVRWPLPGARGSEYRLTEAGRALEPVIMALGRWAVDWLYEESRPQDIDPVTLMWWMHHRVDISQLPESRVVVQFDHTAPTRQTLWLVFDRGAASLCQQHPGFDSDLVVTCSTPTLSQVFSGVRTWGEAGDSGDLKVDGPPRLQRALPKWFAWSPFVGAVRARRTLASTSG
jgi:DNA-binding HxlR family transcriptional regulator